METRSPIGLRRWNFRQLAPLASLALVAACGGGGSGGGAGAVAIGTFNPGFNLRQDVQLAGGNVADAEVADINGDGLPDIIEADYLEKKLSLGVGNGDGSFLPFAALDTPSFPWRVASGDLDGDGGVDLVVACLKADTGFSCLSVYRQGVGGAYNEPITITLPGDPFDVSVERPVGSSFDELFVVLPGLREVRRYRLLGSDLDEVDRLQSSESNSFAPISVVLMDADGDSLPDLVVGELDTNEVSPDQVVVYPGQPLPAGGFGSPNVLVGLLNYPLTLNVGDVDGNGYDDLGVAQAIGGRSLLLLGSASGLSAPIEVDLGGETSSLVYRDFDQDGFIDVAGTLLNQDAISIRMGNGVLSWGSIQLHNVGELPRAIAAAAFGVAAEGLDLFCSNVRDVSVLKARPEGGFRAARGYTVGDRPQFVRTVDLDSDGHLDAVCIDQFQKKIVFMRGDGTGAFTNVGQVALTPTQTEAIGFLVIEDFDEDGQLDVMTAVSEAGELAVLRNLGSLPFSAPLPGDNVTVGNGPRGIDSGDLNGDGHLDVVVANTDDKTIQILAGDGNGGFTSISTLNLFLRPLVVLTEDFDQDGLMDVAVSTGEQDGSDSFVLVLRGDGAGNLSLKSQVPLSTGAAVLHSGDLNENGFTDILATQTGVFSDQIFLILNHGGLQFENRPLTIGFRPGTLEVTDIDQDGHQDLLVPLASGHLQVALGNGKGEFPRLLPPAGEQFPIPHGTSSSALADVNEDGLADIVMASPDNPHIWVALGDGTLGDDVE